MSTVKHGVGGVMIWGILQSEDLGTLPSLCWPCALLPTAPGTRQFSGVKNRALGDGWGLQCIVMVLWGSCPLALMRHLGASFSCCWGWHAVVIEMCGTEASVHIGSYAESGSPGSFTLCLWLLGGLLSVSKAHTHRQSCKTVVVYLIFCFVFFEGGDALYFLHLYFLTQAFGLIFADIVKYVACCLSSELVIDCVLVFFLFSFLYLNHWGTKRRGDDGYMFKLATHGNQGKNSLVFVSVKINNSIQNCLQQTGKWAKDDWRTVQQTMGGSNFYVLFSVCVFFFKVCFHS